MLHGAVSIVGAHLSKDKKWHRIISDPRKNMLIDLKNESIEDEEKVLTLTLKKTSKIDLQNVEEKVSIIALKEYKEYSEAEEQFLIPSDFLHIKNFSTQIDAKKSVFNMNGSWKGSLDLIVR